MNEMSLPEHTGRMQKLRERVDYQGSMLGLLCAIVTILLLQGEYFTSATIAQRVEEDRLALLDEVLPADYYDNAPFQESVFIEDEQISEEPITVYLAKLNNQLSAVVFQFTAGGWGGDINLMIALDTKGAILGLRVLNHKETPGLADKIETDKSDWITKFNGQSLSKTEKSMWRVKKDGGSFDQFTGATITPRAVVNAVYQNLQFYARHLENISHQVNQRSNEQGEAKSE